MIRKLLLPMILLAGLLASLSSLRPAQTAAAQPLTAGAQAATVKIYFFWGDGCPHCAEAEPFMRSLVQKYPGVELVGYEVWNYVQNQQLMEDMAASQGFEATGVPTIFIGSYHTVGYAAPMKGEIEAAVKACLDKTCPDPGAGIASLADGVRTQYEGLPEVTAEPDAPVLEGNWVTLPLVGAISLEHQPLFVSTLLIALVDGVNPCSVWVLSMLLALTVHTGSRRKVLIIGLIFLTVTAGIYAMFIAGLFTVFKITREFTVWIQVIAALVALFFALINIKDYFWYKEGVSLTIADESKPGIYKKMRNVMDASQSFWGMAGATVVLAAGVSLVEFSCTSGFPVMWTTMLNAQGVAAGTFVLLLLVYMLIYQLDEMVIFGAAVFTLKAARLEEKQGRLLKLVGGMLLLTLALVMLINPALMNSVGQSVVVFGIALGAAGLVLLLHRVILPKYGIWIGTEDQGRGGKRAKGVRGVKTARRKAH